MATYVVDIEANGLEDASVIHVMSVGYRSGGEWKLKSSPKPEDIKKVMLNPDNIVIGHYFTLYDVPTIERILGIKVLATIVDTVALAWYIYPTRVKGTYGLEDFGKDYGIPKPKISEQEWKGPLPNETYEQFYNKMKHRCEEDVKINIKVWEDIDYRLTELYPDPKKKLSFINYIMFKMHCVSEQHRLRCKIDIEMVRYNISILEDLKIPKINTLIESMPPGKLLKSKPKKMYKADGSISALGEKWFQFLRERGLPLTTDEVRADANPDSPKQLKKWLFDNGWKPETFKSGANGKVPQVRVDKGDEKVLCKSVLKLRDKIPAIDALDGITVITHRLGTLKGFLTESDSDSYVVASMQGFTNTLRLKHIKPVVNLVKVSGAIAKAMEAGDTKEQAVEKHFSDGQIIRECIVAPEGYELCGSDISSLEDMTKRHYMWDYDPEYVKDQMDEDYDAHLDLAVRAGALTEEQLADHKLYSSSKGEGGVSYKGVRDVFKQANYSCIYKVGAKTLSEATGLTQKEAKLLIQAYWDRNWSIKQLAKDATVITIGTQQWLFNPVNGYYYSIRNEKDIFSTLNQGTGAYVFDCWLKFMMGEGIIPFLQYHDEKLSLVPLKEGSRERCQLVLEGSMEKVNEALKLNVEIKVDVQFGHRYSDVH